MPTNYNVRNVNQISVQENQKKCSKSNYNANYQNTKVYISTTNYSKFNMQG